MKQLKLMLTATLLLTLILTNLSNVSTKAQWNFPWEQEESQQNSNIESTDNIYNIALSEPKNEINTSCDNLKFNDGQYWVNTNPNAEYSTFDFNSSDITSCESDLEQNGSTAFKITYTDGNMYQTNYELKNGKLDIVILNVINSFVPSNNISQRNNQNPTQSKTQNQVYTSCDALGLPQGSIWVNKDSKYNYFDFNSSDASCEIVYDETSNPIFKIIKAEYSNEPIYGIMDENVLYVRIGRGNYSFIPFNIGYSPTNPIQVETETPAPQTYFNNYSCQLELPEGQMWKNINSGTNQYGFNFRPNGISNIVYKTDESTFLTKNIEYLTGQINQNGSTDIDITDIGLGKTLKTIYQITSDCKLEIEIISVKFTDETRPKQITQEGKRVYEVVTESF